MSFSPNLSSDFADTRNRSAHQTSTSGMCFICVEGRATPCAIGLAAVLGSHLRKTNFGPQHFAAFNRKFDLSLPDRSDLFPLTESAKKLLQKCRKALPHGSAFL